MKSLLRISGLKQISYYGSYFIVEFIISTILNIVSCYFSYIDRDYYGKQLAYNFIMIEFFIIAMIGYSFLLTTLVNNSRFGNFLAFILHLFPLTMYDYIAKSEKKQFWMSIVYYCFPQFSLSDTSELVWKNKFSNLEIFKAFSVQCIPMIIIWTLFWYIEQVFPSDQGIAKHPLFFLRKTPQEPISQDFDNSQLHESRYVKITDLSKRFGSIFALHDVNLDMSRGEIYSILGPNGAGKTTLINMLLGLIVPTKGTIRINGKILHENVDVVREKTGYCAQETLLYDELTVEQHLELFEGIRNVGHSKMPELLSKLFLTDSRYKQAKTLSGGQKRKLSVALAFVGNSNFIVLDEPTAGMDTDSRQGLWTLINENKTNRLIVLTTQNLEEADELANRIAILNSGVLVDQPQSPIEWKRKYGYGYKLIIENQENASKIRELILKNFANISEGSKDSSGKNITFMLPDTDARKYADLFRMLENYRIKFSIEYSSLEDAYLNIANLDSKSKNFENNLSNIQSERLFSNINNNKSATIFMQFLGLFKIRYLSFKRNWKRWIELLIPFLTIFFAGFGYFTDDKKADDNAFLQYFLGRIAVFFIGSAFMFVLPSAIFMPVWEKQQEVSHILHINGVSKIAYWVAHILSELLISVILIFVTYIIVYILYFFIRLSYQK